MIATFGYVAGAAVAITSALAALYFAALVLLWTFGFPSDPLASLLRFGVWCVPLSSSVLFLRWVWKIDRKGGKA